jgi:hypothetical protein
MEPAILPLGTSSLNTPAGMIAWLVAGDVGGEVPLVDL